MTDAPRRRFDAVVVWKFDRFARSVSHLLRAFGDVAVTNPSRNYFFWTGQSKPEAVVGDWEERVSENYSEPLVSLEGTTIGFGIPSP